jgi:ATP-dependent Clp protease ATP-binding subunit ClpC
VPSYRFPVLVWNHPGGRGATACLVEHRTGVAAVAETRSAATLQLREMLRWRYRQAPWTRKPSFTEPQLTWVKVEVRPEYHFDERTFPCRETVLLRLPCVRGKDSAGLLLCSLPTLGIRFQFDEEASLEQLAGHYVQLALKGLTPQQLAWHLPPGSAELDDVVIQVQATPVDREPPVDLDPLPDVAEPIGGRGRRGRLARPWERDAQVAALVEVLGRGRGSVLLLGEAGTGKSAVLAEAVRKVERGAPAAVPDGAVEPPATKVRNRFWLTNGSRLIAGMKYLGQWQERVEQVIAKLDEIGGVLCVEHLLDLVRTGGEGAGDSVAAFLVPYLQRGELRLVAEATAAELDACRRLLPALAAAFTVVEVPPFTHRQAVGALAALAGSWGRNLKVEFDPAAVETTYRLFARFLPYHSFPGRAAAFVTGLFDHVSRTPAARVTSDAVVDRFVGTTGLPELFLRDDRPLPFEDVVAALEAKVVGQPAACRTAAAVVTTFKAGLNDPGRPLGALLFCGPTGVGKTELARALSAFLFGHGERKDRLVRLDMSEYAGPGAAARLLGSPAGEPSELVKRVREQPFTVVLLDEIEKAAPEVFDLLLGVFDEGRLTDRFGRTTTFRSAILIMTSNLGAAAGEPFGLSRQPPAGGAEAEVAAFFRPEFVNRVDAVVPFAPLDEATVRQLAAAELARVADREGLRHRGIRLHWSDAVVARLAAAGYDPRYGARPLQRTIEQWVVAPLARLLVDRPALRDATLRVTVSDAGDVRLEAPAPG